MKRRQAAPPPLLEALPEEFREFPGLRCWCAVCCPELPEAERQRLRTEHERWAKRRAAWLRAHGYGARELMAAQRPRPAPSKKHERTER